MQEPPQQYMVIENLQNSIYARFVNSHSFYLICLDTAGHYTFVNPLFASKLAFIAPKLVGMHAREILCSEDLEVINAVAGACFANPDQSLPARIRMPDEKGGMAWSHWEVAALKDEHDVVCGLISIGYDISENENAHREAAAYAQKIDNIIEHITDGFLIIDREWRIAKVNNVLERKIGLKRSQILGKSFWDFFPDDPSFKYPACYRKAMQSKTSVTFEEFDKEVQRWYEVTAYPSDEGLTILFRDVTEKKIAEEKIKDSRNKLSAILNSTTDINILIDPEYKIITFNRKAYDSIKFLYDQKRLAVGQNIMDYVLPGTEEEFIQNFQSALKGKPVEVKLKLFFKPGLALWFLVKYFPIYDAEHKIIGVAFNSIDIDQQQRQYEKLAEIASMYSHDIRRPVATILGITQLINAKELSYENQEWFNYLRKTTLELDRVIHRIVKKTSEIG